MTVEELVDELQATPVRDLMRTAFMLTHRMHSVDDDSHDRKLRAIIENEIERRCRESD